MRDHPEGDHQQKDDTGLSLVREPSSNLDLRAREESNRVYLFFILDSKESMTHSDLFSEFQRYLDSFIGHQ